jgi:hypothetical protein
MLHEAGAALYDMINRARCALSELVCGATVWPDRMSVWTPLPRLLVDVST